MEFSCSGSGQREVSVDLSGCNVGDDDLQHIRCAPHLKEVDVTYTKVTGRGLELLLKGSTIEILWAGSLDLSDADLGFLASGVRLRRLGLSDNARLTGTGFKTYRCPCIEQLDLSDCPVGDGGLIALATTFPRLKSLYVQTALSEQACQDIARIQTLEELVVESSLSNDRELAALSSLHNLRTLILSGCDVTDAGLLSVSELPKLENLDIEDSQIRGLVLDRFPHVMSLTVGGPLIDEQSIKHISAMPQLRELSISRSPISGEALVSLSQSGKLRQLHLFMINVGVNRLRHFAKTMSLELRSCDLPEGALDGAEQLTGLRNLTLNGCRISGRVLNAIANVPNLHTLVLIESEGMTDATTDDLLSLRHIPVIKSDLNGLSESARNTVCSGLPNLEYTGHP